MLRPSMALFLLAPALFAGDHASALKAFMKGEGRGFLVTLERPAAHRCVLHIATRQLSFTQAMVETTGPEGSEEVFAYDQGFAVEGLKAEAVIRPTATRFRVRLKGLGGAYALFLACPALGAAESATVVLAPTPMVSAGSKD